MVENIFVIILAVAALGAGIWAWKLETGGFGKNSNDKRSDTEETLASDKKKN